MGRGRGVSSPWLEEAESVFVGGESGQACRGIPWADVLLLVGPVRRDNVPLYGAPAEASSSSLDDGSGAPCRGPDPDPDPCHVPVPVHDHGPGAARDGTACLVEEAREHMEASGIPHCGVVAPR